MKKYCFIALFIFFSCCAFAQQITRFAVIDSARIYTTFLTDSRSVREYEAKKLRYQEEIQKLSDEIRLLRQKKVDAEAVGKDSIVQRYEVLIASKTNFLVEFSKTANDELATLRNSLKSDDAFYTKLYETIRKIAETEGYSMVLDLQKNVGIIWYSPTVDITEKVISELSY